MFSSPGKHFCWGVRFAFPFPRTPTKKKGELGLKGSFRCFELVGGDGQEAFVLSLQVPPGLFVLPVLRVVWGFGSVRFGWQGQKLGPISENYS